MSHDDDTHSAPGPSSRPLENVAAGSESTMKRKSIEEPQSQENPPPKRQKSGKSKSNAPQASLLPPPEFSEFVGFVYEQGYPPKPRRGARKHPVVARAQGDSMGSAYGPSQMYSGQGRDCDTSPSSSISNAPITSINAQGMGRGQPSKPDLKRKRKAEDGDLYNADALQPRTVVPSGSGSLPSRDEIFRQAVLLFGDAYSAGIITAMHSIRGLTILPPSRYFEVLNPNPPVSILLPEASQHIQQTILPNHTKILGSFFINLLIHFCSSISDIPGVLFSGPNGKVAAFLTGEDVAILRNCLMRYKSTMDPQYLRCPSPVSIPNKMCHPRTTLLMAYPVDRPSVIRVIPVTPAPTQNQMHGSLYTTAFSSQRPILPQDRLSALNSQNISLPTSNSGQLGLGLADVQAQQQLDYGSGMGSSFLSPLPLPLPSHPPLNSPVPLPPGPSVSGDGASRSPERTALPLSLPQVGVSHLSRRSTPAPQPMGMNTATAFPSPHPYVGLLQVPETPTTGMPLISQSLSAAEGSGAGTPGGFDYSPHESAGGGTPAAANPAVVEGYESGSGSYDPDAWRLGCARIRRDGLERLEPVWGVPLKHVQEIREMTREDYDRMYRSGGHGTGIGAGLGSGFGPGSVDGVVGGSAGTVTNSHGEGYLHRQTTTPTSAMTGFSSLEHVIDGTPVFSDSEGGLLMHPAAYDVAGRMDGSGLFPPLANSNWDEHAHANPNDDDNDASGSGTIPLPQLFFSGGGLSSAVDHELDVLDDAASGGVQRHRTNDSSASLSGSLDNDVNPPKTDALPDNSRLSNAQAHLADKDEDAPSFVVAAQSAELSEQLSELDSWLETALVASGQSGVDDGSWFEQFFDESTVS